MSIVAEEGKEMNAVHCLSRTDTQHCIPHTTSPHLNSLGVGQDHEVLDTKHDCGKLQGDSETSSNKDEEFHDCEEQIVPFANSIGGLPNGSFRSNASSSLYQSFRSSEVSQSFDKAHSNEDTIDWSGHLTFQSRGLDNSTQLEGSLSLGEKWSLHSVESKPLVNASDTPDMLVTLSSANMGISAKNESSPERSPINDDPSLETSIFDKVKLKGAGLDTEEIDRMTRRKGGGVREVDVQETSTEEARNDDFTSSTKSSEMHFQRPLPCYGLEAVPPRATSTLFRSGIPRARSAPLEMKSINSSVPPEEIDADAEISAIVSRGLPGQPPSFSPIEERPGTSLSEPFRAMIATSCDENTRTRSTTWTKKRLCFVSYDTDSDTSSIAAPPSDSTLDLNRTDTPRRGGRARTSSTVRYTTGVVRGPRVSPVPRGGIQDFSKHEVFELNRRMSTDPQLTYIDMREWSSKYIGFQSAADYYARMICDLAFQNINILALIKTQLGECHPLVNEIIEKLVTGTSELPSFVLGREIVHRHETKKPHRENGVKLSRDSWCNRVETTLISCGLNTTFFDRSSTAFKSEQEYFEYVARRIRMEDFKISSRVLAMMREQLGDDHVFITSLKLSRIVKTENESRSAAGNDAMRRGRSTSDMHGSNKVHLDGSNESDSQGTMQYVSSKGGESVVELAETHDCSCFTSLRRFMSRKLSKYFSFRQARPHESRINASKQK